MRTPTSIRISRTIGRRSSYNRIPNSGSGLCGEVIEGAFTKLFQIAVLVTGDADFVPVLNEVRRRGVMVVLAAVEDAALSLDLRRAADRFVRIEPKAGSGTFPELQIEGRTWRSK